MPPAPALSGMVLSSRPARRVVQAAAADDGLPAVTPGLPIMSRGLPPLPAAAPGCRYRGDHARAAN